MRKIARFRLCATHSLVTMFKQCVEVIYERLNFGGIVAFDLVLPAFPHFQKPRPQLIKFGQPFLDLQKPAENECSREASEQEHMPVHELRWMSVHMERKQVCACEQSG
jgi:hypothetical protein